jgi:hypothetical protein
MTRNQYDDPSTECFPVGDSEPKEKFDWVAYYAQMSDKEFCQRVTLVVGSDQERAYEAEIIKRRRLKEEQRLRQQAADQQRAQTAKQRKDALPYSEPLALEICERISAGELLTVILLDAHLPTVRRANAWLREHTEFRTLYEQALQDRLAIFEEQLVQIPDEAARDIQEVKKGNTLTRVLDPARITAAKLRVEVRRLHLKAGRPEKWGETSTLITKSADLDDPANMSTEELERRIAEIVEKDRAMKETKVA